jgi:hypothetical protein
MGNSPNHPGLMSMKKGPSIQQRTEWSKQFWKALHRKGPEPARLLTRQARIPKCARLLSRSILGETWLPGTESAIEAQRAFDRKHNRTCSAIRNG